MKKFNKIPLPEDSGRGGFDTTAKIYSTIKKEFFNSPN
jgi:hypothetical protein